MPADACPQKVQKLLQRNYKKAIAKRFQKSYNMVTARASGPAECEIFFFLFLGISGTGFSSSDCSPSQFVSHVPHRRYPASCAKKLVRSGRAFLHPLYPQNDFPCGKV
jgi:hypothetical protein